jgi:TolB-like protein
MSLIEDLKRRNVFRVAAAYAIVAWLLLQIAGLVFPTFGAPDWVMPVFTVLVILGFPVAILLAWALELTPEGVRLTSSADAAERVSRSAGSRSNATIIVLLVVAVVFMFVDNYVLEGSSETATAEPAANQTEPAPNESAAGAGSDAANERSPLPNSVAVLPLESLSQDEAEAYFAAQMHVELISRLRKLGSLNVIAREAVMRYSTDRPPLEQIARELNVESLVIAATSHANDRVRVDVELVDPETGLSLLNVSQQRELSDIFAVQADIATMIAAALDAELSPAARERLETPSTDSEAAYLLYLQAREAGSFAEGIELLDRAISLDPEFAAAYASKGGRQNLVLLRNDGRTSVEDPAERAALSERSFANIMHAIELDPTLGDAWLGLAIWHVLRWQLDEANVAYERAWALDPDDDQIASNYAIWLGWTGRAREALPIAERDVELSPNIGVSYFGLVGVLARLEEYRAALPVCERGREVAPNFVNLIMVCALVEARADLPPEVAASSLKLAEDIAPTTDALTAWWASMIRLYRELGMPLEAERVYRRFEQLDAEILFGDATWAAVHLARGDADLAYERLEAAIARAEAIRDEASDVDPGYFNLITLLENVLRNPILEEPRFVELRQRFELNR